jgi:hypothetical protein
MYSSRVIYNPDRANTLTYLNIGVTRQASGTIVSAALENVKIQFCPSDGVDTELDSFCARLNVSFKMTCSFLFFNLFLPSQTAMAQDNIDPFAMAAWISDVFLTIHPFEVCSLATYQTALTPLLQGWKWPTFPDPCLDPTFKEEAFTHLCAGIQQDYIYEDAQCCMFNPLSSAFN